METSSELNMEALNSSELLVLENEKLKAEIEELQIKNKGLLVVFEGIYLSLEKSQKQFDQQEIAWTQKFNELKKISADTIIEYAKTSKEMAITFIRTEKEPLLDQIAKLEAEAELAIAELAIAKLAIAKTIEI